MGNAGTAPIPVGFPGTECVWAYEVLRVAPGTKQELLSVSRCYCYNGEAVGGGRWTSRHSVFWGIQGKGVGRVFSASLGPSQWL